VKYKYMHNHEDGCKKVAFYFDSEPDHHATIPAGLVMFPDSTTPKPNDPFKCGSCGGKIDNIILEHVEENK